MNKVKLFLPALFIFSLPFCAFRIFPSILGSISLNLSFVFFVPLILQILFEAIYSKKIKIPKYHDLKLSLSFLLCSLLFLFLGLLFSLSYDYGVAYGQDNIEHTLKRIFIPIILILVIYGGYYSALKLGLNKLCKVIFISSICVVLYGYLQLGSLISNSLFQLHNALSGVVEAGKVLDSGTYLSEKMRINLTGLEASEGARLSCIILLPFLLYLYLNSKQNIKIASSFLLFSLFFFIVLSLSTNGLFVLFVQFLVFSLIGKNILIKLKKLTILAFFGVLSLLIFMLIINNFSPELFEKLIFNITVKPFSIDESASARIRYAYSYAGFFAFFENPFFGIGLSKGIFVLEDYFPQWGYAWESNLDFENGTSIAPRSFLIRLLAEGGLMFIVPFSIGLYKLFRATRLIDLMSQKLVYVFLFGYILYGFLGGGNVFIFYSWALLGVIIAFIDLSRGKNESA